MNFTLKNKASKDAKVISIMDLSDIELSTAQQIVLMTAYLEDLDLEVIEFAATRTMDAATAATNSLMETIKAKLLARVIEKLEQE